MGQLLHGIGESEINSEFLQVMGYVRTCRKHISRVIIHLPLSTFPLVILTTLPPISVNFPPYVWPSLKSALRPPPSAQAESANFRPFYVKRADFSPPPPATKKRQKLVKIRPLCPHFATKKGGK